MKGCSFCMEPSVLHCMNRSLNHKYWEESDKPLNLIDTLIESLCKSSVRVRY